MTLAFRNLPPLRALAAFEAVARLRSFSEAAHELCITHSAVSHRIKLLEHHVGAQLFSRRGRNVALTTQGSYFLQAAVEALSILRLASIRVARTTSKIVRVNVGPSFARYWLVNLLGDFYRKFPDIELDISATKFVREQKKASLRSGEWDVAICYGRKSEWNEFTCMKLMSGELFPVCSPSYKSSCGDLAQPNDILKTVLLRLAHEPWKPWLDAAGLKCTEPERGPLFSDASLLIDAAINGQGVALVRSVLVHDHLIARRLVRLFDIRIPSTSTYYAVFQPEVVTRREVQFFLSWLSSRAKHNGRSLRRTGARI